MYLVEVEDLAGQEKWHMAIKRWYVPLTIKLSPLTTRPLGIILGLALYTYTTY